ncbi:M20/M25/M40 family metallo-hydrolase [Acidicapsa ligni]|uniref:M20/M25/M40 family metallo-hydrolase n=1 Tax=Acidicapsa ligni TaxID=542300 RepID=UPI0021E0AB93|nr:M20/M25/M40 family metallo-hydrolase [Acidicapsa ligni]
MQIQSLRKLVALVAITVVGAAQAVRAQAPAIAPSSPADADHAQAQTQTQALAKEIFKQLIEINTTDTPLGNVTTGTTAMQKRFLDAGFSPEDVHLLGPNERKQNLVVRIRGTGKEKPVLFLCHMDVVEALPSDWHTDPFKFVEKDGYYYGRGTQDMKESDAALVATFLRLHHEGYKPQRDLILALTADEESGRSNGASWLVQNHRDLVDAAFVINPDSGGIELDHGKPVTADVEATEKVYADFQVTATNPGGHSSRPRPDNAIYELTAALNKLAAYSFPFELNGVTRAYFDALTKKESGETTADIRAILATPPDMAAVARLSTEPDFNSNFRTTCVATRLAAGHANNALPQTAQANVNCRIFPGHSPEQIRQQLVQLFDDSKLSVKYISDVTDMPMDTAPERKAIVPPPPLPEVFGPLTALVQQIWPGTPVTAVMENGASDSIYFAQAGIPSYGFSAIALERGDDRAHGQDERLPIDSYIKSVDFFYAYTKALGK